MASDTRKPNLDLYQLGVPCTCVLCNPRPHPGVLGTLQANQTPLQATPACLVILDVTLSLCT